MTPFNRSLLTVIFGLSLLAGFTGSGAQTTAAGQRPGESAPRSLEAGEISLPGYRFDPLRDGEPQFLNKLTEQAGESGFRLVQFNGPIRSAWRDAVEDSGLKVLQYYPANTYLVWGTADQARTLADVPAVRWNGLFHPAYKTTPQLKDSLGRIENLGILFYNDGYVQRTIARFAELGAEVLQTHPAQPGGQFFEAIVQVEASQLDLIAGLGNVLWLGYASPAPGLDDEISDQIVAGNTSGGVPSTGYSAWLDGLGLDGSGITWAIIDTGIDYNHPDLAGQIVGGYNTPGACDFPGEPGSDCNIGGHGTHVAGIVGANGAAGYKDANGYLYGLGMAPGAGLFAMNSLSAGVWPPDGGWQEHSRLALLGGALGGNNSWTSGEGIAHGYQATERIHDFMVRDGNFNTLLEAEAFIEVFSAGNSGPGTMTITAPKEAKNLIVVASSPNARGGNMDVVSSTSSRGPAVDGRILPNVTAPGDVVASTRNDLGGDCSIAIPGTGSLYSFCSGTSMAAPHASGAIVLLSQWWRALHAGKEPSPAMAKALLVNSAVDMGVADIPNNNEGWGRINLSRLIETGASSLFWDQALVIQDVGDAWQVDVAVVDSSQPLKISLVWTDAPGAAGANPALVNDLDLQVEQGGEIYFGNHFSGGWSTPGGLQDRLNNLENVYIQGASGVASISIRAVNLPGDGVPYFGDASDQDFALVCSNCALLDDFRLNALPVSQTICSGADAVYRVYVGGAPGTGAIVELNAATSPAENIQTVFNTNQGTPSFESILTMSNTGLALPGHYSLDVTGVGPAGTHTVTLGLDVVAGVAAPPAILSPVDGAAGQPVRPAFSWQAEAGATYSVQVARDPGFTDLVSSISGLTLNEFILTSDLETGSTYYWRVMANNVCGAGAYSSPASFSTYYAPGDCPQGTIIAPVYQEGFESGAPGWEVGAGGYTWGLDSGRVKSGTYAYHAQAPAEISDQILASPLISLPVNRDPLTLSFWNYQSMEQATMADACFDGGLLEVSTDGGSNWSQVPGSAMLTDPYDGSISTGYSNPLGGMDAWCGDPQNWLKSVVNLSAYAGMQARFRFRLGTDTSTWRDGWSIDDVTVQGCLPAIYQAGLGQDSWREGLPGDVVTHTFELHNFGLEDTYTVTVSGNLWPSWLPGGSVYPVASGETRQIQVVVSLPVLTGTGTVDTDRFQLSVQPAHAPTNLLISHGVSRVGRRVYLPVVAR